MSKQEFWKFFCRLYYLNYYVICVIKGNYNLDRLKSLCEGIELVSDGDRRYGFDNKDYRETIFRFLYRFVLGII